MLPKQRCSRATDSAEKFQLLQLPRAAEPEEKLAKLFFMSVNRRPFWLSRYVSLLLFSFLFQSISYLLCSLIFVSQRALDNDFVGSLNPLLLCFFFFFFFKLVELRAKSVSLRTYIFTRVSLYCKFSVPTGNSSFLSRGARRGTCEACEKKYFSAGRKIPSKGILKFLASSSLTLRMILGMSRKFSFARVYRMIEMSAMAITLPPFPPPLSLSLCMCVFLPSPSSLSPSSTASCTR